MSLTNSDLEQIRQLMVKVIHDEVPLLVLPIVRHEIEQALKPIRSEIEAIHNDLDEIYSSIARLQVA